MLFKVSQDVFAPAKARNELATHVDAPSLLEAVHVWEHRAQKWHDAQEHHYKDNNRPPVIDQVCLVSDKEVWK